MERGSPYGVLEQHREGFWKKSQDDEITICPPIWGFELLKGQHWCVGAGRELGLWGCQGLAWGVGTLNPTISTSPSPKATPINTHLNKTWNLSNSAAPPTSNHMLFLETAAATTGGRPVHHLPSHLSWGSSLCTDSSPERGSDLPKVTWSAAGSAI